MKTDITHIVQNQSSREGARIKGFVLHTTEGPDDTNDLANLGNYFDSATAGVSSHLANNIRGMDARYVEDSQKSWAACNLNNVVINLEQIAYSSFTKDKWMKDRHLQLKNSAVWIAYTATKYGFPIKRGKVAGSTITSPGVFQHKDLGAAGCGHADCGDGYPMRYVLMLAKLIQREHFEHHPADDRKTKRMRRRVNRIRKGYGLPAFASPNS